MRNRGEIEYTIEERIGVIALYKTGWSKELNKVSWNGSNNVKFDIRDWNSDHSAMSRGITLDTEEAFKLYKMLEKYFEEN